MKAILLCAALSAALSARCEVRQVLEPLKPGEIVARGWLKGQLELSLSGMGGHLGEIEPDQMEKPYITRDFNPANGARGLVGWCAEMGGEYALGTAMLAYTLGDDALIAKAAARVKAAMSLQEQDGYLGAYRPGDNRQEDFNAWGCHIFYNAMLLEYYRTGDKAILDAVHRGVLWFAKNWAGDRKTDYAGPTIIEPAAVVYRLTGDKRILDFCTEYAAWLDKPGHKNGATFTRFPLHRHAYHVAAIAARLKVPVALALAADRRDFLDAAVKMLSDHRDGLGWQATYTPCADGEWTAAPSCVGETEYCDHIYNIELFQWLASLTGETDYADAIERIVFNAAQGARGKDERTIGYMTSPNQWYATLKSSRWGPEPFYGVYAPNVNAACCPANSIRLYPLYVMRAVLREGCDLRVMNYGPYAVCTTIDGAAVSISSETDYPFDGRVTFRVKADDWRGALRLRCPAWAESVSVTRNGKTCAVRDVGGVLTVPGPWRKEGETVTVNFGWRPVIKTVRDRDFDKAPLKTVEWGALVFAQPVEETWTPVPRAKPGWGADEAPPQPKEWSWFDVTCKKEPVPYALPQWLPASAIQVLRNEELPDHPWKKPPVILVVPMVRASAAYPPESRDGVHTPKPSQGVVAPDRGAKTERVHLVPFGATCLRTTCFPTAETNMSPVTLPASAEDVVFENRRMTLRIGGDACAKSLVLKANGEECLTGAARSGSAPYQTVGVPLFTATQNRPFNNEIKLTHPNKRTTYRANRLRRDGDRLIVGFELAPYEAVVKVDCRDDYIVFTLEDFISDTVQERQYRRLVMDVPPVVGFRVMQLPVAERKNFGDWVNAVWDGKAAVAVMSIDPFSEIDHEDRTGCKVLTADLQRGMKLRGGSAAIVAGAGREAFLDAVDSLEADYGLPRGVAARRSPIINSSICWSDTLYPGNVDQHIELAKRGGFRLMLIYYTKFTDDYGWATIGDYRPNKKLYPRGYDDIRDMLGKIRAAGIKPGLHLLQTHIGLRGRYVTPVADPRLNHTRTFTLASPLSCATNECEILVEENPVDSPHHPKCRVLQFGGELLHYTDYTTEPPYKFTGCTRGHCATRPQEHPSGQIGGVLDISEFAGLSCYIDQRTSLQDEVADKIAKLYDCGFEFCYMDGSEGVNPPCGVNVSYAQWRVARKFSTPPIFTEGAAKSHFGWHLQAGGNAFDVFPPEVFKEKISTYPQANAPLMRRNFTRLDFGWWDVTLPGAKPKAKDYVSETGVQPDMWEWGTSRAAAWDCPATIHLNPGHFLKHPRADDLLEVMRRWEDVRARNWLTAEQKESLKSATQEHHLLVNGKGEYELVEVEELPKVAGGHVRAFLFERGGGRYVTLWHVSGECRFSLPADFAFTLHSAPDGDAIPVPEGGFALSSRVYLRTAASAAEVRTAFAAAVEKSAK